MSQLRELRAWTHELFDQYGWLILASYRQVREYTRSVLKLRKVLAYYKSRRTSAPLQQLIKQVDLLYKRLDRNYGNNNNYYRNSFN